MKLSIGIVGLPNVGKSTLFKLLTKNDVVVANYPFATIDPNVGVVEVPDRRVDELATLSKSKKKIPAVVEFYDIAGLVKGASEGEGLGNQFLSHIRETQAIVQVVRCFGGSEIIHVEETVDPLRDIAIINGELIAKDKESVAKWMGKLEGEARTGDKAKIKELELAKKIAATLEAGSPAYFCDAETLAHPAIKSLNLLTAKTPIYLLNGAEADVTDALKEKIQSLRAHYLVMDLSSAPNLTLLVTKAYEVLGLISFFTTGEDETRAWTIVNGWKAPQAAGAIHTDFENKFIRAEVIFWKDLLDAGGWAQAKQKGKLRLEGKEYVIKDGDVMVVRHG